MYEISLSVSACLRAGTRVDVAWPVQAEGFGGASIDFTEALALTPGGGRIGAIAAGSANDSLADLAAHGTTGRLVTVTVTDFEAQLAGLTAGGDLRCLLVPASELPPALWDRLRERQPVCLVTHLEHGGQVARVDLYDERTVAELGEEAARLFGSATGGALMTGDSVVSVFRPVPRLVIVGGGPIVDAVRANAELLGWRAQTVSEAGAATGLIAALSPLDSVLVAAHDLELAGNALTAALRSQAGYIGALGSRSMQEARADWLAYRGVTELSRVHGPAGLQIGARTPAEIAVAILAEALAVRAGVATSLA